MKFIKYLLGVTAALALATGCIKESIVDTTPHPRHTLIMYMMADNNLESYMWRNVSQVRQAITPSLSRNFNVYILFDYAINGVGEEGPVLYKVGRPATQDEEAPLITVNNTYGSEFSVSDPDNMKIILQDILDDEEAPAETYGLYVSSHGAGWLPAGYQITSPRAPGKDRVGALTEEVGLVKPEGALTKWIGQEASSSEYMDVSDLADGMSGIDFDYIIFDACFMSTIETAYELRNSAKYIVASPVEIMGDGFPMHLVVPELFSYNKTVRARMVGVAKKFYEYYSRREYTMSDGTKFTSGAIAAIDCTQIDGFTDTVREIYQNGVKEVDPWDVQILQNKSGGGYTFHDFEDYMYYAVSSNDDWQTFRLALQNILLYSDNTEKIYSALGESGTFHSNDRISGMAVFIPRSDGSFPLTTSAWYNSPWAKAIGATP